jgi:FkbM family methyltransferase
MLNKQYRKAKARVMGLIGLDPVINLEPRENGEYHFLKHIRRLPEVAQHDCIIDVGANVGDWTSEAMDQFEGTKITKFFCVEPIPTFASKIGTRFAERRNVRVFEIALSDTSGDPVQIFNIGGGGRMYRSHRSNSGSFKNKSASQVTDISVIGKKVFSYWTDVSSGDELFGGLLCRPYLIKIDCDGHDFHVLRGFAALILNTRPLLQFEYSDFWIDAGSRLEDACSLLHEADYSTFKMFPNGLARFRYNSLFETFSYQNIIAVPNENKSFTDRKIRFSFSESLLPSSNHQLGQ